MKRARKIIAGLFVLAVLMMFPSISAQASVTKAKPYELKNVTKAEERAGKWVKKDGRFYFSPAEGEPVADRWITLNDSVYYLDAEGCRTTGWISFNGERYYMDKNGKLHKGWLKMDGETYYLKKSSGKLARGFCKIGKAVYFFSQTRGAMRTGWRTIDGKRYYFDSKTGKMAVSKWVKKGSSYYYLNASGVLQKSKWVKVGDKKYYLDKKGARVTGTVKIGKKTYHFDEEGVYKPSWLGKVINPSKPMVALTFDDGPGKYTERLLKCLKKYNVKATFFMVGSRVPLYPKAVKLMANYGCELGNHTYDHPFLTKLSKASIKSQLSKTSANIKKACGETPTLVRLPYGDGAFSKTVLSVIEKPSIYWSIDTKDYMYLGNPQHTVDAVVKHVKSGDIVLMHDIHYSSVVAAEKIIPALIKKGYQLVTVSELAKYKGKTTLKNGKTYKEFR